MIRLGLWLVAGLLLGGVIHISVVLAVPSFAPRDAWTQIGEFGPDRQMNVVPRAEPGRWTLPLIDPSLAHAVCRFTLDDGPLQLTASLPNTYWSLALFDRDGINHYNLNDRAAELRPINLIIGTAEQVQFLRDNPPSGFFDAIPVEWTHGPGFALLRVFVASPSTEAKVEAAVDAARCGSFGAAG